MKTSVNGYVIKIVKSLELMTSGMSSSKSMKNICSRIETYEIAAFMQKISRRMDVKDNFPDSI